MAFQATAALPSFHRVLTAEGLQGEKSHASHPLIYARFAYSRQSLMRRLPIKGRTRILISGRELCLRLKIVVLLYVFLNFGKSSRPWEIGAVHVTYMCSKSLSVLPPTGPLKTFGFSAIRRTMRRTWVETALCSSKAAKTAAF